MPRRVGTARRGSADPDAKTGRGNRLGPCLPQAGRTLGGLTMTRPAMLDPKRDLAGATPETLARALLRRVEPLRPRPGREAVVRDELPVGETVTDEANDRRPHLVEGI